MKTRRLSHASTKPIANRFAIHDLQHDSIGHGMMGDVYRGTDLQTGQVVAIKALNPQIVASQPEDDSSILVLKEKPCANLTTPTLSK